MAFGDVLRSNSGYRSPVSLGVDCAAGNTIVLLTQNNIFEADGTRPTSVSDATNGAYTEQDWLEIPSDPHRLNVWSVSDTSAGPVAITFDNDSVRTWVVLELEGVVDFTGTNLTNTESGVTTFTSGNGTFAADSKALAWLVGNSVIAESDTTGWTKVGPNENQGKAYDRAFATETTTDFGGTFFASETYGVIVLPYIESATGPDYTNRKGSTLDSVTHGLGTITTATLNAVNVFDHVSSQAAGTISFTGAITDEITTSGEYDLVLGDGATTETYTVQVNVVGLASFNINKDGADQASLTDVEFVVMTGAAGSRVIADQITGVTTDVNGDTGAIEVPALSLNVDDPVFIMQHSATVGGGLPHSATLVAI